MALPNVEKICKSLIQYDTNDLVNFMQMSTMWLCVIDWLSTILELRQYKNGFVSVKRMLGLKLPPFFRCRVGEGKKGGNFKTNIFFTEASPFLYCLSSKIFFDFLFSKCHWLQIRIIAFDKIVEGLIFKWPTYDYSINVFQNSAKHRNNGQFFYYQGVHIYEVLLYFTFKPIDHLPITMTML